MDREIENFIGNFKIEKMPELLRAVWDNIGDEEKGEFLKEIRAELANTFGYEY